MIACIRLSWPPVSFLAEVKLIASYRIVSSGVRTTQGIELSLRHRPTTTCRPDLSQANLKCLNIELAPKLVKQLRKETALLL